MVVIRNEGPSGGPGMQEMLAPTSYIKGMGLGDKCYLITDGRFSGGTAGACIGHIAPEAAAGGEIGLLKNGDIIEIDILRQKLNARLSPAELARRARLWKPPKPALQDRLAGALHGHGHLGRHGRGAGCDEGAGSFQHKERQGHEGYKEDQGQGNGNNPQSGQSRREDGQTDRSKSGTEAQPATVSCTERRDERPAGRYNKRVAFRKTAVIMKSIHLLYGKTGCEVRLPDTVTVLEGHSPAALAEPQARVTEALRHPIGSRPLAEMLAAKRPNQVAITISDITRPVPNREFLPPLLAELNACGVADAQVAVIIGTGMHRPSTPAERETLLGPEMLGRLEVIDHEADKPDTLVRLAGGPAGAPPVSVNKRFAQADFRIVTGYIEPHFMAGYSGGRKGVCPALVDLATIQRFHGYQTLANAQADNGVLEGNPCHQESLRVARRVGVDFLLNVAITRDRRVAGVYAGDLEAAHAAGCAEVARWTAADSPAGIAFDLVLTNGGGYPLDLTFYQTVKGMVTALPALEEHTVLLQISDCAEQLGSRAYTDLMLRWNNDWRGFLAHVARSGQTELDQWEYQMQCRVLQLIGLENLWFVSDGIPADVQKHISVSPVLGPARAPRRLQDALDTFIQRRPDARIAVIPDGPYTLLRRAEATRPGRRVVPMTEATE